MKLHTIDKVENLTKRKTSKKVSKKTFGKEKNLMILTLKKLCT